MSNRRYALWLLLAFAILFTALGINPAYRADWALENALTVIGLVFLVLSYKRFRFSNLSYTLGFIFLCLHEIGSHYTYSEVPYDDWFRAITGTSLNEMFGWDRNHFDRLVHFSFGFLLAYPMREIFYRIADSRGLWAYILPVLLTMAASLAYEMIEWAAAIMFGGELGMAYLGTQGDIWDSHKDSLLATIGALISMLVTIGVNLRLQRDFAREWADSLKVSQAQPLGEEAIKRMLDEGENEGED